MLVLTAAAARPARRCRRRRTGSGQPWAMAGVVGAHPFQPDSGIGTPLHEIRTSASAIHRYNTSEDTTMPFNRSRAMLKAMGLLACSIAAAAQRGAVDISFGWRTALGRTPCSTYPIPLTDLQVRAFAGRNVVFRLEPQSRRRLASVIISGCHAPARRAGGRPVRSERRHRRGVLSRSRVRAGGGRLPVVHRRRQGVWQGIVLGGRVEPQHQPAGWVGQRPQEHVGARPNAAGSRARVPRRRVDGVGPTPR